MANVSRVSVAAFAFVAVATLSCTRETDVVQAPTPTGEARAVPTKFTGEFLQVRKGEPGSGKAVVLGAKLKSADGTQADTELSFTDAAPGSGGSIECGGKTYNAKSRLDQSKTAEGSINVTGLGRLELDVERNTGVIVDENAPPFCDEWAGSWTGTGALEGRRGTFLLVGFHEDKKNIAESTLTITES